MNRYSLLRLLLFTLSAGALTAADMLQPPGPSLAPAEGWYGILRRNVGGMLEKRSDGVTDDDAVAGLDLEKWTTETVQMCAAALNSTTTATNPAGVAACWNLPVVLRDSGVFVADLRIFRVAKPTGDWVNVNLSSYDVLIEYDGSAAIQARNLTVGEVAAAKTGMKGSTLAKVMDAEFIGSLEHTLVEAALVDSELKFRLTPKISIKALSPSGKAINTTIDFTATSYINGVFATTPSLSETQIAADASAAPFVLPGTEIEIIPVGLYFYSAYLVVGCAIFGWGTLERAKFRDQYRKRIATSGYR